MTSRTLTTAALAALVFAASGLVMAQEVKTDLYTVVDGNKVDAQTLKGFKTWRTAACDRCHGANQEGLVGPSLVNSLKVLTKEEFVAGHKKATAKPVEAPAAAPAAAPAQ